MKKEIEIFVYAEDAGEGVPFKVDSEATVEELLVLLSPDGHEEFCLILSGEDVPKERHHRLGDCGIHHGAHVHRHPHKKPERPCHEREVEVVVNGKPVQVKYTLQEPGKVLVERALQKTKNSGQDVTKWELRDANGAVLDQSKPVKEYKLDKHSKLFLNLKAGGGGSHA